MNQRYSKQIKLQEIGIAGQEKLNTSCVAIIGAGGLGSIVIPYLVGAGIKKVLIFENDSIDLSNLNRQFIYSENEVGNPKMEAIIPKLKALNKVTEIIGFNHRFTLNDLEIIHQHKCDLMIDCSDNFMTKYTINYIGLKLNIPYIIGSIEQWSGQFGIFNINNKFQYHHIFPLDELNSESYNCDDLGVIGPVVGVIASYLSSIAIKYLAGITLSEIGNFYSLNFMDLKITPLKIPEVANTDEFLREFQEFIYSNSTSNHSINASNLSEGNLIIDIREEWEVELNPSGYLNIPYEKTLELEKKFLSDKNISFYCQSGKKAKFVSKFLNEKFGVKTIYYSKFSV